MDKIVNLCLNIFMAACAGIGVYIAFYPPSQRALAPGTEGKIISGALTMTPWWAYLLIVLGAVFLLTNWAKMLMAWAQKGKPQNFDTHPTQILSQTYKYMTIPIDGFQYVDCVFENVILKYEGKAGGGLSNCRFLKGPTTLQSSNPAVQQTIVLMHALIKAGGFNPELRHHVPPDASRK